jgi:hypothetical protein
MLPVFSMEMAPSFFKPPVMIAGAVEGTSGGTVIVIAAVRAKRVAWNTGVGVDVTVVKVIDPVVCPCNKASKRDIVVGPADED